jgi:hypothetical protein
MPWRFAGKRPGALFNENFAAYLTALRPNCTLSCRLMANMRNAYLTPIGKIFSGKRSWAELRHIAQ